MIPGLKIDCRMEGRRLELAVSGEIDLSTCGDLRRCLDATPAECRDVVVDLAGVTFMDSSGIAEVVRAASRLEPEGRTVRMRRASPNIRRVLEITGLAELCVD